MNPDSLSKTIELAEGFRKVDFTKYGEFGSEKT